MKSFLIFTQFLAALLSGQTTAKQQPVTTTPLEPTEIISLPAEPEQTPQTALNANEWNRIPILEYHNVGPTEQRWTRQYDNFRKDLLWLYNNDYALLSIDDFARGYFPIPAGKKPVILTFDDGKENQFRMDENGSIDPNSAIGILDEFHQTYPSFGRAAVFYVNHTPFGQKEWIQKKLNYLRQTGRQIGYHTLNHTSLNAMDASIATNILKQQQKAFGEFLPPEAISRTLAYPHGAVPNGDLNQMKEVIDLGLLVGADPAYPLYHPKGNAFRTPRIQAIDSEWLRHFGRKAGETERTNSERFKPFVSDGNPDS